MKKSTFYFGISSIVILFLVGVFIYISATTYSVDGDITMSIGVGVDMEENVEINMGDSENIYVGFDFGDNNISEEENSKYRVEWSTSSDSIELGSDVTDIDSAGNTITALSEYDGNIVVTAELYYDEDNEAIASDSINVTILSNEEGDNSSSGELDNNGNTPGDSSTGNDISGDDEGTDDEYELSSLSINNGSNIIESGKRSYNITIDNVSSINIHATAKNGGNVLIFDEDDNLLDANNIEWKAGSSSMAFIICVEDEEEECSDNTDYVYEVILYYDYDYTIETEGYLNSLIIDSQSIIVDGKITDDYELDCTGSSSDDKFVCNLKIDLDEGTTSVSVVASLKDGYEFSESIPDLVPVDEGNNGLVLKIIESGDSTETIRALYYITMNVPESSQLPVDSSNTSTSKNATSNPGTGDMSSFIIFMIMLVSLVASLFVYKKNVGNN